MLMFSLGNLYLEAVSHASSTVIALSAIDIIKINANIFFINLNNQFLYIKNNKGNENKMQRKFPKNSSLNPPNMKNNIIPIIPRKPSFQMSFGCFFV